MAGADASRPAGVPDDFQEEFDSPATIDAIARYIEALGGRLDLVASFGDHTLTMATTEAA